MGKLGTVGLSLLLSWGSVALGWGHFKEVSSDSASYLTYNFAHNFRINYCLQLEDSSYSKEQLQLQIESAIKVWLVGLERVSGKSAPEINLVNCSDKPSIIFHIRKEKDSYNLQAYHVLKSHEGRKIPYIFMNRDLATKAGESYFKTEDFAKYIPAGINFANFLQRISFTNPKTVEQVSLELRQSYHRIYFTSYSSLIHEVGHAFGLCDTYNAAKYLCDPNFLTTDQQPNSVMLRADQYFLAKDDLQGLQRLLQRY